MLMPSIFGENIFDDFMEPFGSYRSNGSLMKTDVEETDSSYIITMDVPGVKKEDIHAELKDGYLTVNATTDTSNEEKDSHGNYIRRERYAGSVSRSFYVGEAITQEDIKAKFENGILRLTLPKKDLNKIPETKKYIAIEG